MIAQIDWKYIKLSPFAALRRLISYFFFEGRPLTTRGRWINPLVLFLFHLEKACPQVKKVKKPVFILGTGRSGTTILGVVLSMHRDVGFLNEPKALWYAIHPEEDLIGSYTRGEARYRLAPEDATPKRICHAHRLFGAYLAATFSPRVVDKYPELIFRVPFVKTIFPDAKFLFLVRNGWDTCHSISGWSSRLGARIGDETHDWWGVNRRKWNLLIEQIVQNHPDLATNAKEMQDWTNQTDMAAVEWIVTMREGLSLLEQFPNNVLRVDYEALCKNPRHVLHEIISFMEIEQFDERFYCYSEDTLKPTPEKIPFPIHTSIEKPFLETMLKLGYQ